MTKKFSIQFSSMAVLILAVFSCRKAELKTTPPTVGESAVAKSSISKPGTVATVNLSITIDDIAPDNSVYAIQSDGGGDYVNGQQGVSAYLDQYGDLQFDTNKSMTRKSGPALRSMLFHFDNPCIECGTSSAGANITNPYGNYRMVTAGDNNTSNYFQNILVGTTVQRRLGGGFASQISSTTDWTFTFRYNQPTNTIMDVVNVYRPDNGHWIITGNVTRTNPALPVGALNNNGVLSYYYLPFHLTLTAIP